MALDHAKSAILEAACVRAGISVGDVQSQKQNRKTARRRWHVMTILRARGWSTTIIGQQIKRDHTTVIHGLKMWAELPEEERAALDEAVA